MDVATDATMVPLADVVPYDANPFNHSEEQVIYLAEMISRFGFDQPIVVDGDMVIIKGHCRRLACIRLGLENVPVVVREDLTPEEVAAARIADNVASTMTTLNNDFLLSELEKAKPVIGADELGFDIDELDAALEVGAWDFSETRDQFIVTITGDIDLQDEVRARLADLEGVSIEASFIKKALS